MVLLSVFIVGYLRLSNEAKNQIRALYCMISKWDIKQRILLAISTKPLARGQLKNVQFDIDTTNYAAETRTVRMRTVTSSCDCWIENRYYWSFNSCWKFLPNLKVNKARQMSSRLIDRKTKKSPIQNLHCRSIAQQTLWLVMKSGFCTTTDNIPNSCSNQKEDGR